jgi:hypothetical protein
MAPKCRIRRARVVDVGRIINAGAITSGMETGFLLRRADFNEEFVEEVARVVECREAYRFYREDIECV